MSTLRFAEISDRSELSKSFLHLQSFLKSKNININLDLLKTDQIPQLLENHYQDLMKYNLIRLSYESSQTVLQKWDMQPTQVRLLNCCDTIVNESGSLWPRVVLFEALRSALVSQIRDHDIKEAGYVICDDLRGRVLVAVLLSLGHKQVFLVGENEEFVNSEVEFLNRFHIGTDIRSLPAHHLTLQTTRASILISSIGFSEGARILNDLAYFNFMKSGGTVLDLDFDDPKNLLIEEAQRASLKFISKDYLSALYDFSLLKKVNLQIDGLFEEFHQSWLKFSQENSPKV